MKLNLDNIGYVDFNRLHTKLLGKPYTDCMPKHTKTEYFKTYSQDHCLFECLAKWIEDKCGCIPALFPSKPGYNKILMLLFFNFKKIFISRKFLSYCSIKDAALCATPQIMGFNYGSCACLPSCDQKDFIINSVHYGKWRKALMKTDLIKESG